MQKLGWALLLFILFPACVQIPSQEDQPVLVPEPVLVSEPEPEPVPVPVPEPEPEPVVVIPEKRTFFYRVVASSQTVGFNILVNGTELLVSEGPKPSGVSTPINDWMVSGSNELSITIFWPEGVRFTPGIASASFKLFSNDTLVKEFQWPIGGIPDRNTSYPYTFTETYRADGFPKVSLERAERVISSAGVLPRSDQEAIAVLVERLRRAFTEKNLAAIDELLKTRYTDLAVARFTTPEAIKAETDVQYRELMRREGYAVRPFSGRYGYFSTADDRVVRVVQGRIGFPEPILVVTWRQGGTTHRWDMDLYFAKIDGTWVIIR